MYIFDSSVCIEFLRGKLPNVQKMIEKSDPSLFAIPAIVEAELLVGAEKSFSPVKNRQLVERFISAFQVLPFDSVCARTYAQVRASLEAAGNPIGPLDQLIAATALAHYSPLVTNNDREFSRVPGLKVEVWEEVEW